MLPPRINDVSYGSQLAMFLTKEILQNIDIIKSGILGIISDLLITGTKHYQKAFLSDYFMSQ